jgi:ADP-ribose pyrophosphatase YjhB (NUDIX family)
MDILKLFQYQEKLRFADMEKSLNIRSNKLAYHLKMLTKKGILKKEGFFYSLSESSEYLIPYLSQKESYLPVVLILLGNNKKAFLYARKKRPYVNKLSLPCGRILVGETLADASERIMGEKFKIEARFIRLNSISFEQVRKSKKIVHSFILFFVSVETTKRIDLLEVSKHKNKIIPSDYNLISEDFNKRTNIKTIISKTN